MSDTFAALDLGSNSFHLLVARFGEHGELVILDRLKERVRLAGGLDDSGNLTEQAQERALRCLRQFGERVGPLPRHCVRAVGTNTLRRAHNGQAFVRRAREALGHRIDIVSGREEARLIYLGVAHDFQGSGQRLLIDIGGGSTEVVLGEGFEPILLDSLYVGCVSFSMRYFGGGVTKEAFRKAITAARLEFQSIERRYCEVGWQGVVGSSGTILAVDRIIRQNGLGEGITLKSLRRLRKELIAGAQLDGLKKERAQVLPGGLAILMAAFQALNIESLEAVQGALREGIVYDLVGRLGDRDIREDSINRIAKRFSLDTAHGRRVEATALTLFDQADWDLNPFHRNLLSWSARLHEVGTVLTYSGYHKHGAYIIGHADLPGFSRQEQAMLAALVQIHRGKLSEDRLGELGKPSLHRVAVLLRLAVRLHRNRAEDTGPQVTVDTKGDRISLRFPEGWLEEHPLSAADLQGEAKELKNMGIRLKVVDVG